MNDELARYGLGVTFQHSRMGNVQLKVSLLLGMPRGGKKQMMGIENRSKYQI
jgi:hypothetical protein